MKRLCSRCSTFVVATLVVPGRTRRLKSLLQDRQMGLNGVLAAGAIMLSLFACQPAPMAPPLGRFGVCAEWVPDLQAQLDKLGNVWYYDYSYKSPAIAGHPRLFMVREEPFDKELEKVMRSHPGAWWAAGNEPNDPHQDSRSPAEYARFFHNFTRFAKRADPRCKVIPGGIANADWRWARAFREEYRRLYKRYPAVDGWNIHSYLLDPGLDPYDVAEFKRRILAFRHWMMEIGEGDKPLFLTEFGVLYGAGCCQRPVDPPEKTIQFMREAVTWLAETNYVQHWAWFILNNAGDFNGGLYDAEGRLSPYGEAYRELKALLDKSS